MRHVLRGVLAAYLLPRAGPASRAGAETLPFRSAGGLSPPIHVFIFNRISIRWLARHSDFVQTCAWCRPRQRSTVAPTPTHPAPRGTHTHTIRALALLAAAAAPLQGTVALTTTSVLPSGLRRGLSSVGRARTAMAAAASAASASSATSTGAGGPLGMSDFAALSDHSWYTRLTADKEWEDHIPNKSSR